MRCSQCGIWMDRKNTICPTCKKPVGRLTYRQASWDRRNFEHSEFQERMSKTIKQIGIGIFAVLILIRIILLINNYIPLPYLRDMEIFREEKKSMKMNMKKKKFR